MPSNPPPPIPLLSDDPPPTNSHVGPFGNIRLSNAHQEGIYNLFTGYSTQLPIPTGEDLLSQIREDLEPRELVDPMITVNYEIYKKIRSFLNEHGVDTPSTGASGGLIVNRLLHTIWNRPEDAGERERAVAQFKAIKQGTFAPNSPIQSPVSAPFANPVPISPHTPQFTATNSNNGAKGMSIAYSSERQKFWGKSDEDWLTKLSRYQFMCNQNKVTGADKINFLHYLLDGAALQFFINEIEGRISNWGEVLRRFHDRYASAAKQDYISHRLDQIHTSQFEVVGETSEAQALRQTIDEIDRLTPMSHPEDRSDRAKMLHLQQAVLGKEWARSVLSNVTANELHYHTLIEKLEYSLQQTTKHEAAKANNIEGSSNFRTARWKSTNFAGQGRYGTEPSSRNSIVPKHHGNNRGSFGHGPRQFPYPKERWPRKQSPDRDSLTCHNCGKVGCRWFRCKEPLDMQRVVRNRMKSASRNSTSPKVNIAEVVDDLAQDMMETFILTQEDEEEGIEQETANEQLMTQLTKGAAREAAINHNAHFEMPDNLMDDTDPDDDPDATEDFCNRA